MCTAQVVAVTFVPHRLLVLKSSAIQSATAAEHSQQALLTQITEMSANLVFININWKSNMMSRTFKKNT